MMTTSPVAVAPDQTRRQQRGVTRRFNRINPQHPPRRRSLRGSCRPHVFAYRRLAIPKKKKKAQKKTKKRRSATGRDVCRPGSPSAERPHPHRTNRSAPVRLQQDVDCEADHHQERMRLSSVGATPTRAMNLNCSKNSSPLKLPPKDCKRRILYMANSRADACIARMVADRRQPHPTTRLWPTTAGLIRRSLMDG